MKLAVQKIFFAKIMSLRKNGVKAIIPDCCKDKSSNYLLFCQFTYRSNYYICRFSGRACLSSYFCQFLIIVFWPIRGIAPSSERNSLLKIISAILQDNKTVENLEFDKMHKF